jgi:hypothetical protein
MLTCPAAAAAEQVYGGSRLQQRIAGSFDAIDAGNGVEDDLALLGFVADAKLAELVVTLANCDKARSFSIHDRCKAKFEGFSFRA